MQIQSKIMKPIHFSDELLGTLGFVKVEIGPHAGWFAASIDAQDEGLIDYYVSATGSFVSDEDADGGVLHLLVNQKTSAIRWYIELPESYLHQEGRLYDEPHELACGIRFLESALDVSLPFATYYLGDSFAVEEGELLIAGKAVHIRYPQDVRHVFSVEKSSSSITFSYMCDSRIVKQADLQQMVGFWVE